MTSSPSSSLRSLPTSQSDLSRPEVADESSSDPSWFAPPLAVDSAWDLVKIAHHQTLPEYDAKTGTYIWRRDESGATEICGSIATWQQSCPRVEVNVWRVDRATGRPTMRYASSAGWHNSCEIELWSSDSFGDDADCTGSSGGGGGASNGKACTRTMAYESEQFAHVVDRPGREWPTIERKLVIDDACRLMPPAPAKSSGSAERDLADAALERERRARFEFRKLARTMRDQGWCAEFVCKISAATPAASSVPSRVPSSAPPSTASARISSVVWSRSDTGERIEYRVPASIDAATETDLFAPEPADVLSPPPPQSSPSEKPAPSSSSPSSPVPPPPQSSSSQPHIEAVGGLGAADVAEARRLLRLLHNST